MALMEVMELPLKDVRPKTPVIQFDRSHVVPLLAIKLGAAVAYIATYLMTLIVFVLADLAWLTAMVPRVYRPALGDLLQPGVNILPAAVFYLCYPAGLSFFAIGPALKSGSLWTAAVTGALFGLFTYGTYNLTNQATLKNWPTFLSAFDITWGTFLGGATATVAFWLASRLIGDA